MPEVRGEGSSLSAGEVSTVTAYLEQPPVGDGEAETAMFEGAVRQRAAVRTSASALGCLAFGDGPLDVFRPFGEALLHCSRLLATHACQRLPGGCGRAHRRFVGCAAAIA